MNIYQFLKLNRHIRNVRLKLFGIWLLHCAGRRYFGLFLDPVFACNLRCRMCYFSDDDKRKTMKGSLKQEELPMLAKAFFHRALKLQIGCGAEPTIFPHNRQLIELGKSFGVPYISMTTNGNLLSENDLIEFAKAGLDEITLSLHGVTKKTYEYFMQGASFEKFLLIMENLTKLKERFPSFKVRLNYTVNSDNLTDLQQFFDVLGGYCFDILQVRPIQNMGASDYSNFSWTALLDASDSILKKLKTECRARNITLIMPEKKDLIKTGNNNAQIADATYFYVRPGYYWRQNFDLEQDTYESYARRNNLAGNLFKRIFATNSATNEKKRHLNYEIN